MFMLSLMLMITLQKRYYVHCTDWKGEVQIRPGLAQGHRMGSVAGLK